MEEREASSVATTRFVAGSRELAAPVNSPRDASFLVAQVPAVSGTWESVRGTYLLLASTSGIFMN